jgi:hypothetical protein
MRSRRPGTQRALLSAVIAVLVAILSAVVAVVLPTAIASAAGASAAQTRVGAHHAGMILAVGPSRAVSAGEGRGEAVPRTLFVSGTCVAAEDAGAEAGAADGDDIDPGCDDSFSPATKLEI